MNRLSGDQKGQAAPSVPGSGFAATSSTDRTHRLGLPSLTFAENVTRRPSGETLSPPPALSKSKEALSGGGTARRSVGASAGAPPDVAEGRQHRRDKGRGGDDPGDPLAAPPARGHDCRRARERSALGDPLELELDVVRGLETVLGVFGQAGLDDAVERRRRHRLDRRDGAGSRSRIAAISEAWLAPEKAFFPVAIS